MKRREEIERIIVGSCLGNSEYVRDVACISPDMIEDLLSRELFRMLPSLAQRGDIPVNVLIDEGLDKHPLCLLVHAMELSSVSDFDAKKFHHNIDALAEYYFCGKVFRPTTAQFRDYVSQFIRLNN